MISICTFSYWMLEAKPSFDTFPSWLKIVKKKFSLKKFHSINTLKFQIDISLGCIHP